MSEIHNVNRVSSSHLEKDREEVTKVAESQIENWKTEASATYTPSTGEVSNIKIHSTEEAIDAAAAQKANSLKPEDLVFSLGVRDSLIVTRTEFAKFRLQVIAALKHMGVDTPKFFPE